MPDEPPAAAERVPAALAGPLLFSPFRARRLEPHLVGGTPGAAGRALAHAGYASALLPDPCAALHVHEYHDGDRVVRGVVGLLALEGRQVDAQEAATATLLPHEAVGVARVERLAAHLLALELDPAPLLLLTGPAAASTGQSLTDLLDHAVTTTTGRDLSDARGRRHRLWAVTDDAAVRALRAAVRNSRLLLADGHHRYAAHLALAARRPPAGDGQVLAMVVDAGHAAPELSPIHRVVRGTSLTALEEALRSRGHRVAPASDPAPPHLTEQIVLADARAASVVTLEGRVETAVEEVHRALSQLPAATWRHHHRADAAVRLARQGEGVAVLLPALTLDQVWDAVGAGRVLPAKATSFEPKPPLGVLLRRWHDG